MVAFATPSGRFEVRRWSDGAVVLHDDFTGATSVAFSPDGALVGASTAQGVKIWRLSDCALLSTIPALANTTRLAISADGTVAVARSTTTGQLKISRPAGVLSISQTNNVAIGLSPDGTLVATVETTASRPSFTDYVNSLWRVSDGQAVWSISGGSYPTNTLGTHAVFSPDGSKLAVGGAAPRMLRVADGGTLYGTNEPLAFSADGQAFLTSLATSYVLTRASDGATVRSFNVASNQIISAGAFGSGLAMRVVIQSNQANLPASADASQTLAEDGVAGLTFTRNNIASAVLSPEGTLLAIRQADGKIHIRDAASLAELSSRPGDWIAFSPDGGRAAIVTASTVEIFTRASLTAPGPIPSWTFATAALSVAFSPDGTLVGAGNADHTATLWSLADGHLQGTLWNINGHIKGVYGIAFSPDGSTVATAGTDDIIKLWRTADGAELKTIKVSLGYEPGALRFLSDGRLVAIRGGGVDVWDVVAGTRLKSFSSSLPVVSADGATLFLRDSDAGLTINRYSLSDYSDLGPLPLSVTGPERMSGFQIAPNGAIKTMLVSGILRVWCSP
jgi:WD40 repeat protein